MALFGNKVEICIVFVGKHSQQVNALQEKAIINTYHARLKSLIHLHYPGLSRYHSWFFSDWSSQAYSISTLRKAKEEGFSAFDSGEKRSLYNDIEKVLVLQYSTSMNDYHPVVIVESIDPYTGIFTILCRVKVKESKLK